MSAKFHLTQDKPFLLFFTMDSNSITFVKHGASETSPLDKQSQCSLS